MVSKIKRIVLRGRGYMVSSSSVNQAIKRMIIDNGDLFTTRTLYLSRKRFYIRNLYINPLILASARPPLHEIFKYTSN